MKRSVFRNNTAWHTLGGILLFVLLSVLFHTMGHYNFSYIEQWNTYIYSTHFANNLLTIPGGILQIASIFLVQFFVSPVVGIAITALLLTLIALLTADILYCLSGSRWLFPLSLFPTAALAFLHYNINYLYAGSLAFLLMLLVLRFYFFCHKPTIRFLYAFISTLLLFVVAGPTAFLYSLLILLIEVFRHPRQSFVFLSLPLVVCLAAWAALSMGLLGEWKHLLLPDGYFTHRLEAGSMIYLPWTLLLSAFAIACIGRWVTFKKAWISYCGSLVLLAAAVTFLYIGATRQIDRNNEIFKELNYYARDNQWERILERCGELPMNNLLFQNYLNVALAETGALADRLFEEPCVDIRTIYVVSNKTPYISALLSDIYYSMGHIAFSQRYAFEANEAMGNFSPRMLQRLVQTNLIFGQYGTAAKYLNLLANTLYYKEWAEAHQSFLWNDAAVEADPHLGAKRRCLFPDNRFSGIKGLDDDLKQIILQNPAHQTTIQFLGCLYLLSKDMPRFRTMLDTFFGTPALTAPLPVCFQEGVLAFAEDDPNLIDHYQISPATLARYTAFRKEPAKKSGNLWHFLKYRK